MWSILHPQVSHPAPMQLVRSPQGGPPPLSVCQAHWFAPDMPPSASYHPCRQPRVLKQRMLANRSGPKRINFSPPFAAIIPGDTVVEQVFTTGLNNFL